jgi:hypothetical protein
VGGTCSPNRAKEKCVYVIGGRAREKELLGRPRRMWVDNIKIELLEIGWGGVDWIGLAQDRDKLESSCECGHERSGSIECWETIKWLHYWWPLEQFSVA